jgi:hypothetical protein
MRNPHHSSCALLLFVAAVGFQLVCPALALSQDSTPREPQPPSFIGDIVGPQDIGSRSSAKATSREASIRLTGR